MNKKIITNCIEFDEDKILECSIDAIIKYLQEIKSKYPDKLMYFRQSWSSYEQNEFNIEYDQIETDKQYQHRIDEELKRKEEENKKKQEEENMNNEKYKKELNQLKRKFNR